MNVLLALIAGVLFGAGIYSILRRSMVKLILGLVLISHAVNLVLFTSGGISRAGPPVIQVGETVLPAGFANPLPQALVLTAIVISLGTTAFAMVLAKRAFDSLGTDDIDAMKRIEWPARQEEQ